MSNDQPSQRELSRMRKEQLHVKAIDLGLTPGEDWSKADYVAAIERAYNINPEDEGPDDTDDATEPEQGGHPVGRDTSGKGSLRGKPLYHLLVNSEDNDGGSEPVEVSVNGYLYRIPRDTWVVVPEPVVEVLSNAVNTRLERRGTDEVGRPILEERHARRFSYQAMPKGEKAA